MMSSEKSDIRQIFELKWFNHNEISQFPVNVLEIGCLLGHIIDVGPVMNAKMLIQNGQVLQRSTYRLLTSDEIADKDRSDV